ncbi:MAG: HlyD family efflux transporter periplasmic adaptor subunit, partial [Planctomycetota bacterium]
MIRKYLIPLLAVAGAGFGIYVVLNQSRPLRPVLPVSDPPQAPYASYVAGVGLVETNTENISVGVPLPGIVLEAPVQAGDRVKAGDVLFKIDDWDHQSELVVKQAALQVAQQKLASLVAQPRPEDLPPAEAKVAQAQAAVEEFGNQLKRMEKLKGSGSHTEEEYQRRVFAVRIGEQSLRQAQAELDRIKAGAWKQDIEVAKAEVAAAEADVRSTRIQIDRHVIRAPVDGQVLQMKVRKGEYVSSGSPAASQVLLGGVSPLHIRVDVDEHDAWRVKATAPAVGFLQGNKNIRADLKFVRFEPFVVPKKSLTGESTERVDTRVLQVIYSFDRRELLIYVGQQMDVYIQTDGLRA